MTLDEATHQTLKELQDLLAHKVPNGDPAVIIRRALDTLLIDVRKTKVGITDKPRPRKLHTTPLSRAIPAALKREVWTHDQGRCSFVGADGHRCDETRGLEFAHREPWAKGGEHSASNLCLRCRAHNAWEADRDFGAGFMASKRKKPCKVREPAASNAIRVVPASKQPNHGNDVVSGRGGLIQGVPDANPAAQGSDSTHGSATPLATWPPSPSWRERR